MQVQTVHGSPANDFVSPSLTDIPSNSQSNRNMWYTHEVQKWINIVRIIRQIVKKTYAFILTFSTEV